MPPPDPQEFLWPYLTNPSVANMRIVPTRKKHQSVSCSLHTQSALPAHLEEGSGHSLIRSIIMSFEWATQAKSQKTLVTTAGFWVQIWNQDIPHIRQQGYQIMVMFAETECCGWFHSIKNTDSMSHTFHNSSTHFLDNEIYKASSILTADCAHISLITSPSLCWAYCVVMIILYCIYQQPSTDLCPVYWHTHSNVNFCIVLNVISSYISLVVRMTRIWQLHISIQGLKYYSTATTM